jgi:hypothetical protein
MAAAALAAGGLLSMHVAFGQQADCQVPALEAAPGAATEPAEGRPLAKSHGFERRGMRRESPATPQDDSLWQMLQEFYPEKVSQLKALREQNPRRFAQVEREMRPRLRELRQARAENPGLAEVILQQHRNEMAIHGWQSRYTAASDQERQALLEEGRKLVETRVNLRLQREQMRIQMLEKRLQDLRTALLERESQKHSIVDRELKVISDPSTSRASQPPVRKPQPDPVATPLAE